MIAADAAAPVPASAEADGGSADFSGSVIAGPDGLATLHLMVEGIHCGGCIRKIEGALQREPRVRHARVNMTSGRLVITWDGAAGLASHLAGVVTGLGFKVTPFDPGRLQAAKDGGERELLKAMAVAGFAAANVMLLSVSVWAGHFQDMGAATRGLMHWFSALIALPAILYAGRPFFHSALQALSRLRTNMDVPISLAVLLAAGMSLFETIRGGEHAYFDSAITLLFFLLIGRYLDRRARGRARSAAERLLALRATAVTILGGDGRRSVLPAESVVPGMCLLAAAGDRVPVDGRVLDGHSEVDTSLITGETLPRPVAIGDRVYAGTLNLSAPLRLEVTAVGEDTILAEIVRLMEVAEQRRARYVELADRVARFYAPAVHLIALLAFAGWLALGGLAWQSALLIAVAVLIVTCPCALGLAVPAVQVIASGRLLRSGILLKSATALERLAQADTVVFDKTGTLTLGRPELETRPSDDEALRCAAAMAATSSHPLARALARAVPDIRPAGGVKETPGCGLALQVDGGEIRLGSRRWCGVPEAHEAVGPELWLNRPGRPPERFAFSDPLRFDAARVVDALKAEGYAVELLSGDRPATVRQVAHQLGIDAWRAECTPADKTERLRRLEQDGRKVLMVGDGLNDAPALAAALVSLSPSTAADISQTAADAIFQGDHLRPVIEILAVSRRAGRLVHQNFALALLYNLFAVPLAVAGLVTPLVAAICMSGSSLVVTGNALRLARRDGR